MAGAPEVETLDRAASVEMRIVAAGARADLGQHEAAVVTLQSKDLGSGAKTPWVARLRYAYAEALLAVGRADEARQWFARSAESDTEDMTDALDRVAELDGVVLESVIDDDDLEGDEDDNVEGADE
jgi:hypothetical protein